MSSYVHHCPSATVQSNFKHSIVSPTAQRLVCSPPLLLEAYFWLLQHSSSPFVYAGDQFIGGYTQILTTQAQKLAAGRRLTATGTYGQPVSLDRSC